MVVDAWVGAGDADCVGTGDAAVGAELGIEDLAVDCEAGDDVHAPISSANGSIAASSNLTGARNRLRGSDLEENERWWSADGGIAGCAFADLIIDRPSRWLIANTLTRATTFLRCLRIVGRK